MQRTTPAFRLRRPSAAVGLLTLVTVAGLCSTTLPATAEPSPEPTATSSPSAVPTTPEPSATPTGPTASPRPTPAPGASETTPGTSSDTGSTATPAPPATDESPRALPETTPTTVQAAVDAPLTLSVSASQTPVAGQFFQDIGSYAFAGDTDGVPRGSTVEIYRRAGDGWVKVGSARTGDGGAYATSVPVTATGTYRFRSTLGGAPSSSTTSSNQVSAVVKNATVGWTTVDNRINARKNTTVSGKVFPARSGVEVTVQLKKSGAYVAIGSARTSEDGSFSVPFSYGQYHRATYSVRPVYTAANRNRLEVGRAETIKRVAVIDAVVRRTTAADVAETYHAGCPVGRSKLRTIDMNFVAWDGTVDRGVMIVRSTVVKRVIRSFRKALQKGYPIAKMNNPNVYGGDDPTQMAANNTSGFNCRAVVGNPYRMSPHSYGTAIDVNTVQNPYRDRNGRWWPANGKEYIDRTPRRKGMLTKNSTLTKALRAEGYFWGGLWSPGRDYQHFQR